MLEAEQSAKLDAPIRLTFDSYPLDLAGRPQAFQKLVAGGVAVKEALGDLRAIGGRRLTPKL